MRDEKVILNELREVQDEISKIKFVKDTNYEKYNKIIGGKYTTLIDTLSDIGEKRASIGVYSDIGAVPPYSRFLHLKEFVQLLSEFISDVENDDKNATILKGLQKKEKALKDELGIR